MDRLGAGETTNNAFAFSREEDSVASKFLEQTQFVDWKSNNPTAEGKNQVFEPYAPAIAVPIDSIVPLPQVEKKTLPSITTEEPLPSTATFSEDSLPLTTPKVEDLGKWFLKFGDIYDTSGNGVLEDSEIDTALANAEKSPHQRTDKLYLQAREEEKLYLEVLSNSYSTVASAHDDEFGFDELVTKKDLETFSKWVEFYENDLERLKEMAPDKYQTINFLRNEFNQLDTDGDRKITKPELEQYAAREDLTDDQKKAADALNSPTFYQIANIDKSIQDEFFDDVFKLDKLFGMEPSINVDRYTRYMNKALPKPWSSYFSIFRSRQIAYSNVDDMRIHKDSIFRFFSSPEDLAF